MSSQLVVGIADMKMGKSNSNLITYALGSCVGICLYDPALKLGSLIHIMLPLNIERDVTNLKNIHKYADTAIPATIRKMEAFGASKQRITAKIAGGAKMFDMPNISAFGSIGNRNIESVKLVLKKEGIKLLKEDVGLSHARTLQFDISTGEAKVTSYGKPTIIM